ncbi:hypothetical protein NS49R_21755, partial [Enterobacter hormaechei subsp. xiangfangensis]
MTSSACLKKYFLAESFKEQKNIFLYDEGFLHDLSIYEDTGIFAKMHADQGTIYLLYKSPNPRDV